jgi:hypothetical protein
VYAKLYDVESIKKLPKIEDKQKLYVNMINTAKNIFKEDVAIIKKS